MNERKVLIITGASGKLGSKIFENIIDYHPEVILFTPSRKELNLLDNKSITRYFNKMGKLLKDFPKQHVAFIHCAAIADLKKCELNKDEAWAVDVKATRKLVTQFNKLSEFYYISTDYVFDGRHGYYKESDTPNPLSYYAMTKLVGEESALTLNGNVIRISHFPDKCDFEFAYHNKFTSALLTSEMAQLIINLTIFKNCHWNGILHVGGHRCSFYDLAKRSNENVKPMKAPDSTPLDTSFDLYKMNAVLKGDINACR